MALKKIPWSTDRQEILDALNAAIDARLPVTLRCRGRRPARSRITGIHMFRGRPYLILKKPAGLRDSRAVKELVLKVPGLPVLGFSCPVTRESPTVLATMLPTAMHQFELRAAPRLAPPKGSMATFFLAHRSRVSICMMENISICGVKLVGTPTHQISTGDIVGPCTLSLAGRDSLIDREVTIEKGEIVRTVPDDGAPGQWGMGIRFTLSDRERQELQEQLDKVAM